MISVPDLLRHVVETLGGSERPGQQQMAEAVADAITHERHLLVQAGTGTGKSLGYLVPSLIHAAVTGERVVVATATLQLQHQLVERDLPALMKAAAAVLDEKDLPGYAVVKGRGNYACLHRIREGVPDDQGALVELDAVVSDSGTGAEVVALREWAEEQANEGAVGDRDSAPSHSDRAWRQVSVGSRDCIGAARCPFGQECFAERAKELAQESKLLVTNHALLAIDAIDGVPMLPEYGALVVDEAHELVARITQAATDDLDPGLIARVARRARTHLEDPQQADDLNDAADSLADVLTHTAPGRIDDPPQPLRAALEFVRDTARACMSSMRKDSDGPDGDAALKQARSSLDEVWQVAGRMAAGAETDVLWLSQARAGTLHLHIAPIDVSSALREKVFDATTSVLTSATLTIGGSFDPVARSWGLATGDSSWSSLDVGSPFDYPRQGICYVAKHLPPPGRDGLGTDQLGEITALVKAAGGRTLGLFSSRRAAEQAAEYAREALPGFEIWCQGDAQLSELTRRFAKAPESSLFGTLSLWQGVDLPGDTCTLVIIDRIPFPRPDDPLMSARQRLAESRGGNGFMQVAAQHAALLLAQGAGRLIRRADDRGVVAILDPRLVTARYGAFLAAGLPPLWRTTDRAKVLGALERLAETAG